MEKFPFSLPLVSLYLLPCSFLTLSSAIPRGLWQITIIFIAHSSRLLDFFLTSRVVDMKCSVCHFLLLLCAICCCCCVPSFGLHRAHLLNGSMKFYRNYLLVHTRLAENRKDKLSELNANTRKIQPEGKWK